MPHALPHAQAQPAHAATGRAGRRAAGDELRRHDHMRPVRAGHDERAVVPVPGRRDEQVLGRLQAQRTKGCELHIAFVHRHQSEEDLLQPAYQPVLAKVPRHRLAVRGGVPHGQVLQEAGHHDELQEHGQELHVNPHYEK